MFLFDLITVASIGASAYLSTSYVYEKTVQKRESKKIDPIVYELIKSLEGDDGWEYTSYKTVKDIRYCSFYKNNASKITFTFDGDTNVVSCYGGIYHPINYDFSPSELLLLDKAVNVWKYKQLLNSRMDAADKFLLESENVQYNKDFLDLTNE